MWSLSLAMVSACLWGTTSVLGQGMWTPYGCLVDLCFVVDRSETISYPEWQNMLEFVAQFVGKLSISDKAARVGLVSFDQYATIDITLDQFSVSSELQDEIRRQIYQGDGRRLDLGLSKTRRSCFATNNGDRSGVQNVAMIITNGNSSNVLQSAREESELMRRHGMSILIVGVGPKVDYEVFEAISGNYENIVLTKDFDSILNITSKVLKRLCSPGEDFGIYGPWSDFSSCSKPCDYGLSTRSRQCPVECLDSDTETKLCNALNCEELETEGVVLTIKDVHMLMIVMKEEYLIDITTSILNGYSLNNPAELCGALHLELKSGVKSDGIFLREDIGIAQGYPKITGDNTIQIKLMAEVRLSAIAVACMVSGRRRRRTKETRHVAADYLWKALNGSETVLVQELGMTVFIEPQERIVDESGDIHEALFFVYAVYATFGFVGLVAVIFFAYSLVCMVKDRQEG